MDKHLYGNLIVRALAQSTARPTRDEHKLTTRPVFQKELSSTFFNAELNRVNPIADRLPPSSILSLFKEGIQSLKAQSIISS